MVEVANSLRKCCHGNQSDWKPKVPEMARKLEHRLYHSAASFSEYNDLSTLSDRLRSLARRIQKGMNERTAQPHAMQQSVATTAPGSQRSEPGGTGMPMNCVRSMGTTSAVSSQIEAAPAIILNPGLGSQVPSSRKVVNLNDINPIIACSTQQSKQSQKSQKSQQSQHKRQNSGGSKSSRRGSGDSRGDS